MLEGELETVEDPENLCKVAPGRGRVEDRELELLVRSDDEDGAAGEGHAGAVLLVGVDHAPLDGKGAVRVGDDGIVKFGTRLGPLNILNPALVGLDIVA